MAYMPKEDKTELYTIKLEKQGTKWTKGKKIRYILFYVRSAMNGLHGMTFLFLFQVNYCRREHMAYEA